MRFIGAEEVRGALDVRAAVDALEVGFSSPSAGSIPRAHHLIDGGEMLLMPASDTGGAGVKIVTVNERPGEGAPRVQGIYVLLEPQTMRPSAAIDGAALTTLRTAAVSALATEHLAPPEARSLVIVGPGIQGKAHLDAMLAIRPLERVSVIGRERGHVEELVRHGSDAGLDARVGGREDIGEADIICTCTNSPAPVLHGSWLTPGTHVNAIGAYRSDMRELDAEAVIEGSVFVETRESALIEAGDLLLARPGDAGSLISGDLHEVVTGARGRRDANEITIFKSVGLALEDLIVARSIVAALP